MLLIYETQRYDLKKVICLKDKCTYCTRHHFTRYHIHYNRYVSFHSFPRTFDEFIFRYVELYMDASLDFVGYVLPTSYKVK